MLKQRTISLGPMEILESPKESEQKPRHESFMFVTAAKAPMPNRVRIMYAIATKKPSVMTPDDQMYIRQTRRR